MRGFLASRDAVEEETNLWKATTSQWYKRSRQQGCERPERKRSWEHTGWRNLLIGRKNLGVAWYC